MRAFGAEVIEFGEDFDTARQEAYRVAEAEGLVIVPPFHRELVRGVATYGLELLSAVPDLDTVYVPIGCGSGICGTILARDALGLKTKVVGVVSENAQTAKLSAEAGRLIETDSARTFADGMAVRVPVQAALDIYGPGAARIVTVSDAEVAEAIRIYYRDIHNLAEGAGAAPLAALMQERDRMGGQEGRRDPLWRQHRYRLVPDGDVRRGANGLRPVRDFFEKSRERGRAAARRDANFRTKIRGALPPGLRPPPGVVSAKMKDQPGRWRAASFDAKGLRVVPCAASQPLTVSGGRASTARAATMRWPSG